MSGDVRFAKPSHKIAYVFIRLLCFLYSRVLFGFRCRDRYKIKKGEPVLVLSNHQTDADPLCILPSFNTPPYPVATDSIFSGGFLNRFFNYIAVIPKKKGASDVRTVIKILDYLKHGRSVLLFPEGNRYYAEFQYYIAPELATLVRRSRATLVLFNLHGGSGVSPRFAGKKRRGRFYGEIKRVIKPAEYDAMDDASLHRTICDELRVYDSDAAQGYKSPRRAEYIERMLFCCPVCGKFETIRSKGARFGCTSCGMSAEYGSDLRVHGVEGFERLIDWWEFEKRAVRDMTVEPGKTIFADEGVSLSLSNPFKKREKLCEARLELNDKALRCGDYEFELSKIASASVVSGRKLTFVYEKNDYTLRGDERFNPLKYIFALNRLDTAMSANRTDRYFNLGD